MEGLRNYKINFIKDESLQVTKEQAENALLILASGATSFDVDGEFFLCHQLRSVTRLSGLEDEKLESLAYDF